MQHPTFLIVQTAFIGDAILATSLLEKLHEHYPYSKIDFLVRKGNEGLFQNHPFINQLIVWNKKSGKYKTLLAILISKCGRFQTSGCTDAYWSFTLGR